MHVKSIRLKVFVAMSIALALASSAWGQAVDDGGQRRGFLFEAGIGVAQIYYGSTAESYFASATALGLDRVEVALNLDAGWALTQQLYAVASVDGFATRFSDSYGYYLQLNSYLFGGGLRWYPFGNGLVIGVNAGIASMSIVSNVGVSGTSPSGWGAALSLGYDFNSKPTGMSVIVGIKAHYSSVSSDSVAAASLFADVAWK
jgi:hypothetical protein